MCEPQETCACLADLLAVVSLCCLAGCHLGALPCVAAVQVAVGMPLLPFSRAHHCRLWYTLGLTHVVRTEVSHCSHRCWAAL